MLMAPQAGSGFVVWENQGAANLGECLHVHETGQAGLEDTIKNNLDLIFGFLGLDPGSKRYAWGYQSVEQNTDLAAAYRFVKIDGQVPNMKNFVESDYGLFGSTTMQCNDDAGNDDLCEAVNGASNAEVDAVFEQMVVSMSDVANLRTLNEGLGQPFGWSGFTAIEDGTGPVLPAFPFDPHPATGDDPIQAKTHVIPGGIQNTCFGPDRAHHRRRRLGAGGGAERGVVSPQRSRGISRLDNQPRLRGWFFFAPC